ncbi:MAG: hypothetical protein IKW13_08740 [Thermoguttaceae bacterium]|nr:hypothetical protein [Thermoguttaceae bacterium]
MIDFWARLDESDVEKYAKTLILPDYMSHLNLRPFTLSDQRESASGREPLTLLYVGDGRLEELELLPERDALPLIASLDLGVNPEKIRLPNSGAYWTWNDFGPTHPFFSEPLDSENDDETDSPDDETSPRFLRVYFEPSETTFSQTLKFDAQDAYVSVSRQEIFFSWRVLEAYLKSRCLDLLAPSRSDDAKKRSTPSEAELTDDSSPTNDEIPRDAESQIITPRRVDFAWDADFRPFGENYAAPAIAETPISPSNAEKEENATDCAARPYGRRALPSFSSPSLVSAPLPPFVFDFDDQNIRFRFGKIAGSLVVANAETFEDALSFSGLKPTLTRLSEYIYFDVRRADPRLDESGVRLRLLPVATDENAASSDERQQVF